MDKEIDKKIQVLTQKAKETNAKAPQDQKNLAPDSNIPNSLAEHIKTKEQAKSFITLLNSL
jgi:hypothetical protein